MESAVESLQTVEPDLQTRMASVYKPPSKRALLIGINKYLSPFFADLGGCVNDVKLVSKLLTETFQFPEENITLLYDDSVEKPTRGGILYALHRLVADTQEDDVVVVFYAGHGSRRRNSSKPSGYNETIVPSDSGRPHGRDEDEQFAVNLDITDDELHDIMLCPLTTKTSNLVLIFDSCHSSHIVRDVQCSKVRFVEADETDIILEKPLCSQLECTSDLKNISRSVEGTSGWLPVSDRYVLLSACHAHEKANEKHITSQDTHNIPALTHGAWTYELCRAILSGSQSGNCCTYRLLFERAFPLVTEAFPTQHPTIEGALNRAVFGVDTVYTMPYAIVVGKRRNQLQLSCGAAHGFCVDSQFLLCLKGTIVRPTNDDDPNIIGIIRITEVDAVTSWACNLEGGSQVELDNVEIGSPAFEVAHAFGELKVGVKVVVSQELQHFVETKEPTDLMIDDLNQYCQQIKTFVELCNVLFLVNADDSSHDCITVQLSSPTESSRTISSCSKPFYMVYGADGQLEIGNPIEIDPDGTTALKSKLELFGKYHRVLRLNNDSQQFNLIQNKVEMQLLRRITDGNPWQEVQLDHNSLLPTFLEDQYVGARITNKGCVAVEIALLELAEDGSVCVLYPPNGVSETIEPGSSVLVGDEWPALSVASSINFQETFKLFVTTDKTDFSILEQGHFRGNANTSLEELLFTNKMRIVGKRAKKDGFWTTVQRSFKLEKKIQRDIVEETCCVYYSENNGGNITSDISDFPNDVQHFLEGEKDETLVIQESSLDLLAKYRELFLPFESDSDDEESNAIIDQFYRNINPHISHNIAESENIESSFKRFLAILLGEKKNIIQVYRMIRALWINDESAERYQCQQVQTRLSAIGFSHVGTFLNPSYHSTEYAKAHYNVGLILSRNGNFVSSVDAICHYKLAIDVWNKDKYPVDHGETLMGIANVYSDLVYLTGTLSEKIQYASDAIEHFKKAYAIFEEADSTSNVQSAIYNLCALLLKMSENELSEMFIQDTKFAIVGVENTIAMLRTKPLTPETAELLVEMLTAKRQILQHDLALPWQEDVIEVCSDLLKSTEVLREEQQMNCDRLMSIAYSSRLVGHKSENLQNSVKHLLAVIEFYSSKRNDFSEEYANAVINLGAIVDELRDIYISPETDAYIDISKKYLEDIVSGSFELQNEELKASALYNLCRFTDDNFEDLKKILVNVAKEMPLICAHVYSDMALKLISKSFPDIDEYMFEEVTDNNEKCNSIEMHDADEESGTSGNVDTSEECDTNEEMDTNEPCETNNDCDTIGESSTSYRVTLQLKPSKGFSTTRFSEFKCCGGNSCSHTQEVLFYLEEAEKLLQTGRDEGTNYIKNLGVMGRYWATHCELSVEQKLEMAWTSFSKAIDEVERLWPLYNVDAQITFVNEVGQLWEDALDVALELYDILQTVEMLYRVLDIISSAKSRNLLIAMQRLQSDSEKAQCMDASTTPSSSSLSVAATAVLTSRWRASDATDAEVSCSGIMSLRGDELAVEWWMSSKQYAICIVYSKTVSPEIFHVWNEVESDNLYKLCLEANTRPAFHSWEQTFIHSLSQALCLQELHTFLSEKYRTATRLFLLPHVYLHCIPIHALPVFEGKSMCLLDLFPGGISYLPNSKLLTILRQPSSERKCHTFLFQADPIHDLLHSNQEVQGIKNIIEASQNTCDIYPLTTSQTFTKALPSKAAAQDGFSGVHPTPFVMHVACHGEWNKDKPEESYLLLEDGQFSMSQFKEISLTSCRLAVLSACNSGLRNFSRSHMTDINIGFGAQFLAKGCRNVLLTMSPVSDQATSELMLYFYRGMFEEKKTISASLRDAQLKLRDKQTTESSQGDEETERLVGKKSYQTRVSHAGKWMYAPFILIGTED